MKYRDPSVKYGEDKGWRRNLEWGSVGNNVQLPIMHSSGI